MSIKRIPRCEDLGKIAGAQIGRWRAEGVDGLQKRCLKAVFSGLVPSLVCRKPDRLHDSEPQKFPRSET